uniref:PLOD1-3-like GT domain-containing protein n=1 Tax=Lotharella globosa TaxID=91324 RepID=A0A7S3YVS9_9EUKA
MCLFAGFHICGHLFPEAPIPGGPRWLNSGAFVGYADAILDILDLTQELPSWFIDGYPGTDQGFFTQVYLSGKFGMKLDVCNDVFTAFAVHEAESENQVRTICEGCVPHTGTPSPSSLLTNAFRGM